MKAQDDLDVTQAKAELLSYAEKNGALVCRIADAAAFTEVPEGFRPGDLLPRAKSVVVIGGNPPRAGDWASPMVELQETMGTSDRINALGTVIK